MAAKKTLPTKSLLQGAEYVNHNASDIRIRFAAIKAELAAKQAAPTNVKPMRKAR